MGPTLRPAAPVSYRLGGLVLFMGECPQLQLSVHHRRALVGALAHIVAAPFHQLRDYAKLLSLSEAGSGLPLEKGGYQAWLTEL